MAATTAKTETGATWAARMDNTTLRNWTASQLYDFSSILTSGYFNYGRYANGMDFSNIGAQAGLFNQFGTDGYADSLDLYNVNSYHYTGLDPAAVDPSSSYAGNNPANGNLPNRTSSSSGTDPYPGATSILTANMKHLRAGMFSMLSSSQIAQISTPWAIPLSYWTGQWFTGTHASSTLSYYKQTRMAFNLVQMQVMHVSTEDDANYWSYSTPFYMDDVFNYSISSSSGTQVTSLPSLTDPHPLINGWYSAASTWRSNKGNLTYGSSTNLWNSGWAPKPFADCNIQFSDHGLADFSPDSTLYATFDDGIWQPQGTVQGTGWLNRFSTPRSDGTTRGGYASTFRTSLRTQDRVAITGIAAANWAYLGSWLDSSGNYLNIGDRKLASSGINDSPWAYNFFQYFASTDGNIDDNVDTVVIRLLSAQQISYIGTKAGTTSWVSGNSVYVKASGWAEVGVTFLGDLSGTQLALVSNLETFSNDELAALTPWQVTSGFIGQNWSSLSGAQLNKLAISTSDASKNTFAYLPTAAFKGLSTSALRLLDVSHVAQIPLRVFDTMIADQINALGTRLGAVASAGLAAHLTNGKISQLGDSFFNGLLNGDFLNALTITQLGQIPSASFGQLSNAAVAGLNATTLARLSDAQLGAISNQQYINRPNGLLLRTTTTGIDMAKLVANPLVDWSRITYYFLNQLSQANFNLLTPAIWRQIPVSVLGRLTLAQTQRLSESALNALSDNQFGVLKFVGLISTTLIKKVFTGTRVSGLRPYSFWSYVTPAMFNALSCKAETINGVAYSNVVARIPVAAISQLPVSVFAGIDTAHLEAFTNSQLANLTPNQFAAIDASKFLPYTDADGVVHPSRILTQVSLNTFKALQPTQIRRLYEFLFNTVDNNAFANVTEEQATANKEAFATLLGRIMDGDDGREKWLGNAVNMLLELNWLDADVVANIDLAQIQSDKYMNINWGWMSATFLNSISAEVFSALKPTNLVQINLNAMAGLDAEHIAALTATQIGAVFDTEGTQVAGLTAAQLSAMSSIDQLSAAAIAAITPAVLAASNINLAQRSSAFLNALTAQQYAALTAAQLAQFSDQQLMTLPIDWSLIGADTLNGLSSAQFRLLSRAAKVVQFSARAFAGLEAARWVDLALSVDSLTTSQVKTLRQQLLDGLLPAEAQALHKAIGSDILQLQVLEIALVRLLASLNPEGENQYATALSAVLTLRSQSSEKWTTGNVALLLSQLQFNIQRGKNLQVDSAPSAYFYSDLFDRQINQLAMLPLQSPTTTSAQIGSLVAPYLAFIQGAFEPEFLTPSYNGPDGFAETQDPATYQEHLLQALLRFEDNLGKAPYTLYSLQEIDDIVADAYDAAKHNITTTGGSWDSLSDGERYRLVGQAMQSELLDKASVKVLTAAGQTSINSTLVDSAEMLTNLGTVMYLVNLANDPNNSIGSVVAELGLSDTNRIQYLGQAVFAALQQVASDTKQSVRALGAKLEQYLSGLGVASTRMANQFSSFKTELGLALGQLNLEALLSSGTTTSLGNSSLTQDAVTMFNSLQSRLGVDLKTVLAGNLGISAAESRSLSVTDLIVRLKANIVSTQNDLNAWSAQIIDVSSAIASRQGSAWPLNNLSHAVWSLFVASVNYKRPAGVALAFTSTAPADAVDDILQFVSPLVIEVVRSGLDITGNSPMIKVITEGPLVAEWNSVLQVALDQALLLDTPESLLSYTLVDKYETIKFYTRSLYARNGVHISSDQADAMLGQAFVKRVWEYVGRTGNVQRIAGLDNQAIRDFRTIFLDATNEASAAVFGLGQVSYIDTPDGVRTISADAGWNSLKEVDSAMYVRLEAMLGEVSDARLATLTKIGTQRLKNYFQAESLLSADPAVSGSSDAASKLRALFYKINSGTPILTEEQGGYQLPLQPGLKELFFRSQGNILNPSTTAPGVDLPAPAKAVLLTALREAAANGYFDADPATRNGLAAGADMSGKSIIDTPEVVFTRMLRLIDPDVFYNTAGVDFSADLPGPGGTIVNKTIVDLRPNVSPETSIVERTHAQVTAQEVIKLTGSAKAAYELLSKGRNGGTVELKYSQQFLVDAYQEVYKGVLESYLKAHPNLDAEAMGFLVKGLERMSNIGGIKIVETNTPLPIADDQISNIFTRGIQNDGYSTPGNDTYTQIQRLVDSNFNPVNPEGYKNGFTTGFTKAVRSVVFADQGRKLDVLVDTFNTEIARDYANHVAFARRSGNSSVTTPEEFFSTRLNAAYNQTLRQTQVNETFFEQCKAFGVVPADATLDSMRVWDFRARLSAASVGLEPDQAVKPVVYAALIDANVEKALVKSTYITHSLEPGQTTEVLTKRSFRLAVLGGNTELTTAQRNQARSILASSRSNSISDLTDAAVIVVGGGASPDTPEVRIAVQNAVLEEGNLSLNSQRVRANSNSGLVPEIETFDNPVGPAASTGTPSASSDYADPVDLLRQATVKAATATEDVYVEPVVIQLKPATPALLKRMAIDLVRASMRDKVFLTPEELSASIKNIAKQGRISLVNGEADIETIASAYYAKIEEINQSGLSPSERQSVTKPLGERPSVSSGTSASGVTDTSEYSTPFGSVSPDPQPAFGANPSNSIVLGSDATPDAPTNAQLQENSQVRRALAQAQNNEQPAVAVNTRAGKAPILRVTSILNQNDVNDMMRLSLTTWLDDSYAKRFTHIDEFLRSKGLSPVPDYVDVIAERIDGSLSRMFGVLLKDDVSSLSSKSLQTLKEIGFEITPDGWKVGPGVDWDKVVDSLYNPITAGADTPVATAFHKKIDVLLTKLVSADSEIFPNRRAAIEVLTRRLDDNISYFSGEITEVPTVTQTGDRSRLGNTPIETMQVDSLSNAVANVAASDSIVDTPDAATGISVPRSRSTGSLSTLNDVAGTENPVVVGGNYSKLKAAVKGFFNRLREAVAGAATGTATETPAQVQAEVINQVENIYVAAENQGQPDWMDVQSRKFRITARQMAEAYKSDDGTITPGQGNTALRESVVKYLAEEFGITGLVDEGLVEAYFKAMKSELGRNFQAIDSPDFAQPFHITETGAVALNGLEGIAGGLIVNDPADVLTHFTAELEILKIQSVPATRATGLADPVYDMLNQFITRAQNIEISDTLTVPQLLDRMITIANDIGTDQNGGTQITEMLNSLKQLQSGTHNNTPEGQLALEKQVLTAFKKLTTDIQERLGNQTPQQAQKTEQFTQLVEDLSIGLSTAQPGQVINDADTPAALTRSASNASLSSLDSNDYFELNTFLKSTSKQGEPVVNTPDAIPPHEQTLGGAGNGGGGSEESGVHLPSQSDSPAFENVTGPDGSNAPIPQQGGAAAPPQDAEPVLTVINDGDLIEVEVLAPAPDVPTGPNANGVEPMLPPIDGTGGNSLLVIDVEGPTPPARDPVATVLGTTQGELAEVVSNAPTAPSKELQLSRWARINNYLQASPTFKVVMNVTNVVMGVLGFLLSAAGMGMAIYGMVSAIRNRDKMTGGQFATAMIMGAAGILNSTVGLIGIGVGAVAVIATKAALAGAVAAAELAGKALGVVGAGLGVAVSLAALGLSVAALSGTSGDERDVAIANIAFAATQATIAVVGLIVTLAVCAVAGPIGWIIGIVVAIIALLIPNFGAIVQAEQLVEKGTILRNEQLWGQLWSLRCYYDVAYLSSLPTAQLGAAGYVDYLTGLYGPSMTKKWFDFEAMLEQEYAFIGDSSFVLRMDGVARNINYKEIAVGAIGTVHQTLTHAYSLMVTQQELEFFDKTEYTNTVRQAYITDYTPAPVRNPILHMATIDGNKLTLRFDRQIGGLDEMLPNKEQFTVKIAGSVKSITGLVVNSSGDIVLTLAEAAAANQSVTFSYTAPTASNQTHAVQDPAGYRSSSYTDQKVLNLKDSTQAAPQLVDAYFNANTVRLVFDQLIDTDAADISTGSFSVNAYVDTYLEATSEGLSYVPVDIDAVVIKGNIVELELSKLTNGIVTVLRSDYTTWTNGLPVDVSYTKPSAHPIKSVSTNGGLAVANFTVSNHLAGDSAKVNVGTTVVLANQAASFGITRSGYVTGFGSDHSITIAGLPTGTLTYDHGFDWTDSWFTNSVTDELADVQELMGKYGNSDQVYALEADANASEKIRYLHKTNAVGELSYLSVSATKLAKDSFYLDARDSRGQNTISLDTKNTIALGGWGGNTFSFSRNLADSLFASVQNPGLESSNVVNISGSVSDSNTYIDLDHLVHSRYLLPRASFRVYGSGDGQDRIVGTGDYQTYYATGYGTNIELWGAGAQVSLGSVTTTKLHGNNAQVLLDMAQWYMFGRNPAQSAAESSGTIQANYGGSSVINLSSTNFGEQLEGHVNFSNSVTNIPAISGFAVRVNSSAPGAGQQTDTFGTSVGVKSVRVSGNSVILTLNQAVSSGQWVGLRYARPNESSERIHDVAGYDADDFNFSTSVGQTTITKRVDKLINRSGADLKPAVVQASVNGNTVTLRFDENLQSNVALLPKPSAFVVKVNGVDVKVTALSVVDRRLLLTLASSTVSGDLVDVGYSDINDTLDDDVGVLQSSNTGLDAASLAVRAYNVLTSTNAPTLEDATVNGSLIALSFSDRLDTSRIPLNSDYVVSVNNQTVSVKNVLVNNNGVLLTLNNAVVQGAVVNISYSPGNHDGTLRGLSNRAVASWTPMTVFNQTGIDSITPLLQGAELAGRTVTLTFSEDLDISLPHRPDKSVFAVDVNGTVVSIDTLSYTNNQITLTLNSNVEGGKLVRVAYTPSDNQPHLRDLAGLELAGFSGLSVRNLSRDVNAPTITSAVVNGNYLTITFSEFMNLENLPQLEKLHVRLGAQEVALVNSNLKDEVLTLSLGVAALPGATVSFSYDQTPNSESNFQDNSGNRLANVSNHAVLNITGKDIDPPTLIEAKVNGSQVVLTMSENMVTDAANIPGLSSFVVQVNDKAVRMAANSAVVVSKNTITLTLSSAVAWDDLVKVSYAVPPVQTQGLFDLSGNAARSFSSSVSNKTLLSAPTLQSIAVDGYNLLINYDQDLDSTKGGLPGTDAFRVEVRSTPTGTGTGTVVKVNTVVAYNKTLMLVLAEPVARDKTVLLSYTKPVIDTSNAQLASKTGFIRNQDSVNAADIAASAVLNLTDSAQLQTVKVNGTDLAFVLSQPLSLDDDDKPVLSSFEVMVDGKAVTPTAISLNPFGGTLTLPTAVTASQVVTLAYTNNSSIKNNTETHRLRDFFGYEVGSFTAKTAVNTTPKASGFVRPNLVQSVVDGDQVILTYDKSLASAQSLIQLNFAVDGAIDANGKPLKTGKVNASGFLNFLGSNTNGDTYDLGDQSKVEASKRLVYLQLGEGKDNVVTYRDTTGMVLSPSSTGNASISVMPNAALTLYSTLNQDGNLKPILKDKADQVLLYAGSSLQGVLNGYESIDAREPSSTVSAELGVGKHQFQFGGQSYGMVIDRVDSITTIKSPLTPYDTQQGQLLEFKQSTTSEIYIGREADGTVVLDLHMLDSANKAHDAWVYYDGGTSNVRLNAYDPNDGTRKYMFNIDKLVETLGSVGLSSDSVARTNRRTIADASSLSGQNMNLYRMTDVVKYNLAHSS